jgi:DNA-binding FadR family transcriptional regulator
LTRSILRGEIKKGSLLPPERELAEQMGVSRTVVREGTKILQSHGLVTVRQGSGTMVNGLTTAPVKQVLEHALSADGDSYEKLLEARLGLEVQIAALAADRATGAEMALMESLIGEFEVQQADLKACARLDVAFHEALARATKNPIYLVMLEPLSDLMAASRLRSLSQSHPSVALVHHRAILAEVIKRRPQPAARAMQRHIEQAMAEFQAEKQRGN